MALRTPILCLALVLLSACDSARPVAADGDASASTAASCTRCHGSGTDPAPPRSARGETSTTAIGVGAHQAHLRDGALHRAFACTECHVVPTDSSHVDGVARVAFGPTANSGGVTSTWDHASATCATYCHGATLPGGALVKPVWTAGPSQAACGSCHGAPPPAPHPQGVADCGGCHPGYGPGFVNVATHVDGKVQVGSGATGACGSCHAIPPPAPHPASTQCGSCHPGYTSTSVVAATHANGVVDVVTLGCTSCHGDASRASNPAAPPADTSGNTATTARGVGAHQAHLGSTLRAGGVACTECHVVPTSTSHSNGAVDLAFGALATTGGAAAAWNPSTLSCATTYCHGATLGAGGTAHAPIWTQVDGTQKTCGSCHGAPPPAPHVQSTACGSCHAGYTSTSVNPATHLNGTIDLAGGATGGLTCTSCHGDASRASNPAAPPADTSGNTATTARGVGAHQAHLGSTLRAGGVACTECHVVPSSIPHSNGTVDLTFGALARTSGATPAWNPSTLSCATTYCHGATLGAGGTAHAPIWTQVDGTQKTCGSCHGAPPPAPHVQSTACGSCHVGYSSTSVNPLTHLDGQVQVTASTCTSCHGDANRTAVAGADANVKAAPPVDASGHTATTARGVGAHQAHVNAGSTVLAAPFACAECHVVPTSTSHSNGVVNVTFGPRSSTGGATPSWNGATCATYCHGATLAGGTNRTPSWTGGASQAACGTCHGRPPSTGQHSRHSGRSCGDCHGGSYTASVADPARHVNGTVEIGNRITSWNPTTRACVGCHGSDTW